MLVLEHNVRKMDTHSVHLAAQHLRQLRARFTPSGSLNCAGLDQAYHCCIYFQQSHPFILLLNQYPGVWSHQDEHTSCHSINHRPHGSVRLAYWISIIRSSAKQSEIWDYIDQSINEKPLLAQRLLLRRTGLSTELEERARNDRYTDSVLEFHVKLKEYKEGREDLICTLSYIQKSLSPEHILHGRHSALFNRPSSLTPTSELWRLTDNRNCYVLGHQDFGT